MQICVTRQQLMLIITLLNKKKKNKIAHILNGYLEILLDICFIYVYKI